jgi:hypothetical protein
MFGALNPGQPLRFNYIFPNYSLPRSSFTLPDPRQIQTQVLQGHFSLRHLYGV